MKFDARSSSSAERRAEFLRWLGSETVSTFDRAQGDPESLKTATFLFANRVREAGIEEAELAEVLGESIARAGLSPESEGLVLGFAESFDSIACAVHDAPQKSKRWWQIW